MITGAVKAISYISRVAIPIIRSISMPFYSHLLIFIAHSLIHHNEKIIDVSSMLYSNPWSYFFFLLLT